jgi:hypothetical protein
MTQLRRNNDHITRLRAEFSARYLGAVSSLRAFGVALALTAAALVLATGAIAAPGKQPKPHKQHPTSHSKLWATVNICDTEDHPNTIGIRGSMPGRGLRGAVMYMRFQVQYFRSADTKWLNVGASGDSGFIRLGSARARSRQYGRNFTLEPPAAGGEHIVRGYVTYEWRRSGKLLRRQHRLTVAGHPNTVGADPADFSAAVCEIR